MVTQTTTMTRIGSELGKLLLDSGLVNADDWSRVQAEYEKTQEPFAKILSDLDLVTEAQLKSTMEAKYGVPYFSLSKFKPDLSVLEILPVNLLKQLQVIPVVKQGNFMFLARANPQDKTAIATLKEKAPDWQIKTMVCTDDDLVRFHGKEKEMTVESPQTEQQPSPTTEQQPSVTTEQPSLVPVSVDGNVGQDPVSLMLLANELISKAIEIRCSDMHVEPENGHVVLRYLKNKELLMESQLPKPVHSELVFCYKVIAGLNIAETSKPQDKRATIKIGGQDIQFRVTTIPGDFGETVAISFKFD
jgi:type IV pilus assembly protein PilB